MFVQDLRTGAGAAWNARARFPAASTLKLAIAVELMRELRGVPPPGSQLAALLWRMLVYSDDRSANELLEVLGGSTIGGSARVNSMMRALDLADSDMYGGYLIEDSLLRSAIPLEISGRPSFIGKATTAWDLARLERALHLAAGARGALIWRFRGAFTPADARYLMYLLAHSRTRGGLNGARGGATVLHKAGWITNARHDSGLLYTPHGAFVVAVLTWNGRGVGALSDLLATRVALAALRRPVKRFVPRVLRENPVFRRVWFAQAISLFGDQISMIAIPLTAVLVLDANAKQMGYLVAAELVPNLFFALHAGAWVDRRGRRRQTMIFTDLARAALLVTIPVAYAFDALTIQQLYVVAFLVGTMTVFFFVSYSSLFVALVERDDYVEANSLLAGSRAFSFVAGPSIGGILVQLLKAPYALLVDSISFLFSAAFLSSIDPVEPEVEEAEKGHVVAGVRYILTSSVMRSSLLATATINLFNFVFHALFILYAVRSLHVRPATLGIVLGAGAIGGLVGSVVTSRLGRRIGIGPTYILGCIVFPVPLVLVPLAGGPYWLILAMLFLAEFGAGLGVMILDISAASIFAALVPHRLRSRVSGAYMVVNNGVRPVGSLIGGFLGTAIGLQPTLWIGVVGATAGFLWLLPSPIPKMRELPELAE